MNNHQQQQRSVSSSSLGSTSSDDIVFLGMGNNKAHTPAVKQANNEKRGGKGMGDEEGDRSMDSLRRALEKMGIDAGDGLPPSPRSRGKGKEKEKPSLPIHPFFNPRPPAFVPPPQARAISTVAQPTAGAVSGLQPARPKSRPAKPKAAGSQRRGLQTAAASTPTDAELVNILGAGTSSAAGASAGTGAADAGAGAVKAKPSRTRAKPAPKPASSSRAASKPADADPDADLEGDADADADSALPLYSYLHATPSPTRVLTRSPSEMNDLLPLLRSPIGFDMEWKFGFTRAPGSAAARKWEGRTGVIQMGDERWCLILQVGGMRELPREVRRVIEDEGVAKMGVNIRMDMRKLVRDFPGLHPRNIVELSFLAKHADPSLPQNRKLVSLARLTARYLHRTLAKDTGVRCSDWSKQGLGEEQVEYAANDVHACWAVGRVLWGMMDGAAGEGKGKGKDGWVVDEDWAAGGKTGVIKDSAQKLAAKEESSSTSDVVDAAAPGEVVDEAAETEETVEAAVAVAEVEVETESTAETTATTTTAAGSTTSTTSPTTSTTSLVPDTPATTEPELPDAASETAGAEHDPGTTAKVDPAKDDSVIEDAASDQSKPKPANKYTKATIPTHTTNGTTTAQANSTTHPKATPSNPKPAREPTPKPTAPASSTTPIQSIHLRAYLLWHASPSPSLPDLQRALRPTPTSAPLEASKAVEYVIRALMADPGLKWDRGRMRELLVRDGGLSLSGECERWVLEWGRDILEG